MRRPTENNRKLKKNHRNNRKPLKIVKNTVEN